MEIPDIQIKGGEIDIIKIPFTPQYLLEAPTIPIYAPVTEQIGVPVVDMLVVLRHMRWMKITCWKEMILKV